MLRIPSARFNRAPISWQYESPCGSFVEIVAGSAYIANDMLSRDELYRYARHLVLPGIGKEGQQKLKAARILVVGAGGLGSPAALYLAAAGVGTLGILDGDVVDVSNLQRQILHLTSSVGVSKVQSAKDRLNAHNPHVSVVTHNVRLRSDNAMGILNDYDIIIDGSDNFPTRYLINDACVLLKKPMVYGSIFRFEGQVTVFYPPRGPCYRCAYPEPPPPHLVQDCADAGVLGVVPGIIGTLQATEAIKLIVGRGQPLIGRLMVYDALGMQFHELHIKRNAQCPVCGSHPTIRKLIDYEEFCGVTREAPVAGITVEELRQRLDRSNNVFILDVREPEEFQIANIGGHLIPLNELPARIDELDPQQEIVVMCHHGNRSAYAVEYLRQVGFPNVKNLEGGIDAWSLRIDQRIPRY